jgi:hypothetical protein
MPKPPCLTRHVRVAMTEGPCRDMARSEGAALSSLFAHFYSVTDEERRAHRLRSITLDLEERTR